jgi:hypothetical protein
MLLRVGTKRLNDAEGVLNVRGKRQIALEWGPAVNELMLTMDLYTDGGRHVARLRRNQWTFNDNDRFAFVAGARGFELTDTQLNQVALRGNVVARDSVTITDGTFFNIEGNEIDVRQEPWANPKETS